MSSTALQAGDRICVTGANGFIASHLVRDLLQAGFRVRGTVRDPANSAKTEHLHALAKELDAQDRLEIVAGDLLKPGSFDDALAGCDGLCHAAAAVAFSAKDPQRDIIDPSVEGTLNVLESARKAGTVRRVVHTSSMAAVYGWDKPPGHLFTESDWNSSSTLESDPYGLAKVSAEKAACDFVAALPEDERFELVHLNPGMVWGPPMIKAHCKASPKLVRDVLSRSQPGVPKLMLSVVDVRDVSQVHLQALTHSDPPSRCLVFAENHWMNEIMKQLQGYFPDVRMGTLRIPKIAVLMVSLFDKTLNTRQLKALVGRDLRMDNRLSQEAYGISYRSVEETLKATAEPMIAKGWARVKRR